MSIKKSVVVGLLVAGFSTASYAEGWSVGVFAGQTSFDELDEVSCFGGGSLAGSNLAGTDFCDNDTDGTALGINVGYQFTDSFGLEAGYANLDEYNADITIGGDVFVGEVFAEPEVLYAAVVGSIPLSERFSLTGRAGYYDLDAQLSVSLFGDSTSNFNSVTDSGFYAGASLDYAFSDQFTAQLRYDDFGLDAVSLGLKIAF